MQRFDGENLSANATVCSVSGASLIQCLFKAHKGVGNIYLICGDIVELIFPRRNKILISNKHKKIMDWEQHKKDIIKLERIGLNDAMLFSDKSALITRRFNNWICKEWTFALHE